MTFRFRVFVGIPLLAIWIGGCRDRIQHPLEERLLSLLPTDTAILVGIRVPAFVGSAVMKRIEEDVRQTRELNDALEKTGMSLSEAIRHLYIAVPPDVDPRRSDAPGRVTALLDTALGEEFLSEAMNAAKGGFRQEDVEGVPVWVNRIPPDAVALASLKGGVIAFGPFDAVRDVVLRSKKKLKGLNRKSSLLAQAGEVRTDAALWGVVAMAPVLAAEANATGLSAIHHLVFAADYTTTRGLDLRVRGVCTTEAEAQQVKENLDALTGLAGVAENLDPHLEQILATLVIGTDKNAAEASLTISPEALATWIPRIPTP